MQLPCFSYKSTSGTNAVPLSIPSVHYDNLITLCCIHIHVYLFVMYQPLPSLLEVYPQAWQLLNKK